MICNRESLLFLQPIKNMLRTKEREHGVSYGLTEAGYDIRINQDVQFDVDAYDSCVTVDGKFVDYGTFTIASAIEEFDMPDSLVGVVHDKSTWARHGLSVFNTVIEPGFKGGLTLELVYHGRGRLHIPRGAGIAQVLFSRIEEPALYQGKYQHQPSTPVGPIMEH